MLGVFGLGRAHCAWVEGMRKRVRGEEIREVGGAGTLVGRQCGRPVLTDGGWAQGGSSGGVRKLDSGYVL